MWFLAFCSFPKNNQPVRMWSKSSGVVGFSHLVDVVSQSPPLGFNGASTPEFLARLFILAVVLASPLLLRRITTTVVFRTRFDKMLAEQHPGF